MKERIGIITFHCSHNYGSILQSYALQKYLINKNYDVKIIDYTLRWDYEYYQLFRRELYRYSKKAVLSDLFYFKKNLKRKYNFEKFSKRHLITTNKKYYDFQPMEDLNSDFDIFICGSDQIWNFDCTRQIIPAYFLDFADNTKIKIAYAPSMAHSSFYNIDKVKLQYLLNKIDYISVREKSTINILKDITDKPIECVLDPTLLLEASDYNNLMEDYKVKEKYIFMYMLEENHEMIEYCRRLSKVENMKVYYIRKKNINELINSKNVYGISPGQFLYLIKNSQFIITNSFHATVFSILFEKKFITFKTQKSYLRMTDLLVNINLQERIYSKITNMQSEIDYRQAHDKLKNLRKYSEEYLNRGLMCGKDMREKNE